MAVNPKDIKFFLSSNDADSYQRYGVEPAQSLGGYACSRNPYAEYQLSGGMTDKNAIVSLPLYEEDSVPSPASSTPLVNSGAYTAAANLIHWYRLAHVVDSPGSDWIFANPLDFPTLRGGLTGLDRSKEQPGIFNRQRKSLSFDGTNDAVVRNTIAAFGIVNAWTIGVWARTTTVAAGNGVIFELNTNGFNNDSTNMILVRRESSNLFVRISDATTTADQKELLFNSFFSTNTWYHVAVRWDGTTLSVFKNGILQTPSSTPENDSVTQTNVSRGACIGGAGYTLATPADRWTGQIHSLAIWDAALNDANCAAIAGLGDGDNADNHSHVGKWVVFVTGANANEAREIISHDKVNGKLVFTHEFSNLGSSGDYYRFCSWTSLWDDGPSTTDSINGQVDHRMIFFTQSTGESLLNVRYILTPLNGSSILEYAPSHRNLISGASFVTAISVDTDLPDLTTFTGNSFSTQPAMWVRPADYATAELSFDVGTVTSNPTGYRPIWLRRTTLPATQPMRAEAWLFTLEAANGSITPGPHRSSFVVVSKPLGFTPNLTVSLDRVPRINGGANITGLVTDAVSGLPAQGASFLPFVLVAPSPGSITQPANNNFVADASGQIYGTYTASTDEADAGANVTIQARIAGEP